MEFILDLSLGLVKNVYRSPDNGKLTLIFFDSLPLYYILIFHV